MFFSDLLLADGLSSVRLDVCHDAFQGAVPSARTDVAGGEVAFNVLCVLGEGLLVVEGVSFTFSRDGFWLLRDVGSLSLFLSISSPPLSPLCLGPSRDADLVLDGAPFPAAVLPGLT